MNECLPYLGIVVLGAEDAEDDVVVVGAHGAVPPHHGLAEVDRLAGHHELVEDVQAPRLAVLLDQFL